MGKWPLEVFKMCCYMVFPVTCFHYFNQPENFEELITQQRRETLRKETPKVREQLRDAIEGYNTKQRLKEVEALEASEKRFNKLNL